MFTILVQCTDGKDQGPQRKIEIPEHMPERKENAEMPFVDIEDDLDIYTADASAKSKLQKVESNPSPGRSIFIQC